MKDLEKEANLLAMELLMPTGFIKQYVEDFKPDIFNKKDMENMSIEFEVPETLLAIRLRDLELLK